MAQIMIISTANAENDDWLKKADPQSAKEELEIHAALAKERPPKQPPKPRA